MDMNFNFHQDLPINKGRIRDVLFEDVYVSFSSLFGIFIGEEEKTKVDKTSIIVWTDKGMQSIILNTEGVLNVDIKEYSTKYWVKLDPRYDREIVKKEIEANILCTEKKEKMEVVNTFIPTEFKNVCSGKISGLFDTTA